MATAAKKAPAKARKATPAPPKVKAKATRKVTPKSEVTPPSGTKSKKSSQDILNEYIMPLVKQLNDLGIPTSARGRTSGAEFLLAKGQGIPGQVLVYLSDIPQVTVYGDAQRHQAVLKVVEKNRTLTFPYSRMSWEYDKAAIGTPVKVAEYDLRRSVKMQLPENTVWTHNITYQTAPKNDRLQHKGTITAKVPGSTMYFLVGIDESSVFISELPKAVTSVAGAHKLLRPEGVTSKALRQGEWFFEPVDKLTTERIEQYLKGDEAPKNNRAKRLRTNQTLGMTRSRNVTLETYALELALPTTHTVAEAVKLNNVCYARGKVSDRRLGHHDSLELKTWHRIYRNGEVVSTVAKQRSYD